METTQYNSIIYYFKDIKNKFKSFGKFNEKQETQGNITQKYLESENRTLKIYYHTKTQIPNNSQIISNRITVKIKNYFPGHTSILKKIEQILDES